MYVPAHFNEQRPELLQELIRERPLGTLVTLAAEGLNANHVPFEFDAEPAQFGTLRCHVARANPIWRDFSPKVEALVIFQGPKAYVSPAWYPSKQVSGEVVPTYNYMIVHGYGAMKIIHDREWLRGLVTRLTNRFESERAAPWQVTDAPAAFIDKQLGAIVGIEIALTKLIGKWKVSQNRPDMDREGVIESLSKRGDADSAAIAKWVKEKLQS
ncbi:MAG: FMN-binding negative transcriptional regulator [Candidatus Binatia bacterium]